MLLSLLACFNLERLVMADKKNNDKVDDKNNEVSARFDEAFPETVPEDYILASPEDKSELHDQIETLSKALKEAQEKVDSHWERLLRKEAELQNVQRRAEQDVDNARKFAIERFAQELLEVLDSLEQGLTYTQNGQATVEHLKEGMTLTQTVLLNAMDKQGIKPISPELGVQFESYLSSSAIDTRNQ